MVKIIVSLKNKLDEFFTSSQNEKRKQFVLSPDL